MKKEIVNIAGINNRPGTFHHVVKANGFLFLSSQLTQWKYIDDGPCRKYSDLNEDIAYREYYEINIMEEM